MSSALHKDQASPPEVWSPGFSRPGVCIFQRAAIQKNLLVAALALLSIYLLQQEVRAAVKLPSVFSSHMVLQRDQAVPVWGWAAAGEAVAISIGEQTKQTTADENGRWRVQLNPLPAGGPHELKVQGKNTITIKDVLVGEVWLASGQSNMVHIMPYVRDAKREIAAANYPQIRIFTAAAEPAQTPQEDCRGNWLVCNPKNTDNVSAVAYFFARALHRSLGVPVGVVNASLGSTPIEAWTSLDAQQKQPELQPLLASWEAKAGAYDPVAAQREYERLHTVWEAAKKEADAAHQPLPREPKAPIHPQQQRQYPAVMYNAMIAPLAPYAVRGVIWYQGEYNAQTEESASLYAVQLPLLIADWRERWGSGGLPFTWVQLPNFDVTTREPVMTGWPMIRESMRRSLTVPLTGMAVAIDLGDADSVHPANKFAIAERLALWARAQVYGEKVFWSGPLFESQQVSGREVALYFHHTDRGLIAKGGPLRGFEIAGADERWRPAEARIDGKRVIVSHPEIPQPVAVRYAWAANPDGNLYNGAQLPASPFRTAAPSSAK
jgi:sialate O-acetylesterase